MKKIIRLTSLGMMCLTLVVTTFGQNIDKERMERDIEVAENVLGTLLRQSTTRSRSSYFFSDVKGNYTPGFGVIFSLPFNDWVVVGSVRSDCDGCPPSVLSIGKNGGVVVGQNRDVGANAMKDDERQRQKAAASMDSARNAMKAAYIDAMKTFLADYGDLIGQLKDNEKIMVTNRPSGFSQSWTSYSGVMSSHKSKRTLLSAEVLKSDLSKARQGQLTRSQLLQKIKVTNTESKETVETDLELFSSILNR
jgi:hypothetical protein